MKKIVFATKNNGKLKELSVLLNKNIELLNFHDISFPDVIEDQDTFIGNSKKKAIETSEYTNMPTLAEDSGLEVDALNGDPGIYSARYAKMNNSHLDNTSLLLSNMASVPFPQRTARFRCVTTFVDPQNGHIEIVDESCKGLILRGARGSNGFGFDPVFYFQPLDKTFAELSMEEKNKVSHRGKAMRKMAKFLETYF